MRRAHRQTPDLHLVDHPLGAEEQNRGVGIGNKQLGDKIFLAGCHARTALAAAALGAIGRQRHTLDIAAMGHGHDHVFTGNQVFDVMFEFCFLNFAATRVGELIAHFRKFILEDGKLALTRTKDIKEVLDLLTQFGQFGRDLVTFQTGQAMQAQFKDCARLCFGQAIHAIR